MYERYSVLWLWLIVEYIFGEHWNSGAENENVSNWGDKWAPDNHPDRVVPTNTSKMELFMGYNMAEKTHDRIDQYSQYIEKNREQICQVRMHMIQKIQDAKLSEQIDHMRFVAVRRLMYDMIGSELKELRWR
jgi:hypothetical protein